MLFFIKLKIWPFRRISVSISPSNVSLPLQTLLKIFTCSLIVIVSASWWVWVMLVIKTMIDFINNTTTKIIDIRQGIREVRQLFKEYEKNNFLPFNSDRSFSISYKCS